MGSLMKTMGGLPLWRTDSGWVSLSGPDLRQAHILVGHITRQKIARRAHDLDRIELDLLSSVHGWPPRWVASDIEMVGATCSIPVWVILSDLGDVPSNKLGNATDIYSVIMAQPCNWKGQEEESGFGRVLCDEVAFHEEFLEVALAGIVPPRFKVHR